MNRIVWLIGKSYMCPGNTQKASGSTWWKSSKRRSVRRIQFHVSVKSMTIPVILQTWACFRICLWEILGMMQAWVKYTSTYLRTKGLRYLRNGGGRCWNLRNSFKHELLVCLHLLHFFIQALPTTEIYPHDCWFPLSSKLSLVDLDGFGGIPMFGNAHVWRCALHAWM